MATANQTWETVLQERKQQYIDEFVELLRIPSISTSEANIADVKHCAEWVADRMGKAGVENVEVAPTGVHACVTGNYLHAPGKPTILIYGHFDVQPADPLELWDSPPFEPVIKDGCVYARGASDMKGNLLLTLAAFESILQAEGNLPVNVKFLFEGQEEIGSRDLQPFVHANREKLACDFVLTPDGAQWSNDRPAMWMGFKGLCALQIDLETAAMDGHSGLYGGAIPNALHAMVQLLGTLRDSNGNILVEGFYDQVIPLTDDERRGFAEVPFDEAAYKKQMGVDALIGEPGYTTHERAWARPTLEVNGVYGGYEGDGVKTVIPAQSHAKITCRLVADQDPDVTLDKIEAHIKRNTPAGARITVTRSVGKARAYLVKGDHPGVKAVADVLTENYGNKPYYVRVGGTLPIMDMFLQELNAYTVDVGFSLEDERMHSPNEFTRLANFERGQVVYGQLLKRFGQMEPASLAVK